MDREINLIVEQLNAASSFVHIVAIIEKFLLSKLHLLKKELPIDRALPYLLKEHFT